jgi:hypothetical protein
MAKPILIVRTNIDYNSISDLADKLSKQFNDYHVLVVKQNVIDPIFETYNDCSGLSDIDIRELIKITS